MTLIPPKESYMTKKSELLVSTTNSSPTENQISIKIIQYSELIIKRLE